MSYPARSRDKSCNHHTATATRPLPHGYHYTATATWLPPHSHRHTATTTRPSPPLTGSRAGLRTGLCDKSCARLYIGTFNYRNLPKALGPRALLAALNPLAPTVTPFFWPAATLSSWSTPFINHSRWRPLSLSGPWLLPASDPRRPLAHRALLVTVNYQGIIIIRNGRVIEPIVRGGGHGGRGGRGDFGGIN